MSSDLKWAAAMERALWSEVKYYVVIPVLSLCDLVPFICSANMYLVPTGRYNIRDLMVKRDPAPTLSSVHGDLC